eukprot:m.129628 g.129628  ORF g.129628 m.129628 type:complete len:1454 (+) comp52317_c0_seq1:125-4486(+)
MSRRYSRPSVAGDILPNAKNAVTFRVRLLDGDDVTVIFDKSRSGRELLLKVTDSLRLVEHDYFGLYFPSTIPSVWLDTERPLKKQIPRRPAAVDLEFGVRFYVSHPDKLCAHYARYLFFLQIKEDITRGTFFCSPDVMYQLCGLAVQEDLGNFDPNVHTPGYLSAISLLPNQTHEMENAIQQHHQELRDLKPADAEYKFLQLACQQEMYGVDLHPLVDASGQACLLGVSASGLKIFKQLVRVGVHLWRDIVSVTYSGKKFTVNMRATQTNLNSHSKATLNPLRLVYKSDSKKACLNVFNSAVQRHIFYRRRRAYEPESNGINRSSSLTATRSTASYGVPKFTGRTQFETFSQSSTTSFSSEFVRTHSISRNIARTRSGVYAPFDVRSLSQSVRGVPSAADMFAQRTASDSMKPNTFRERSGTTSSILRPRSTSDVSGIDNTGDFFMPTFNPLHSSASSIVRPTASSNPTPISFDLETSLMTSGGASKASTFRPAAIGRSSATMDDASPGITPSVSLRESVAGDAPPALLQPRPLRKLHIRALAHSANPKQTSFAVGLAYRLGDLIEIIEQAKEPWIGLNLRTQQTGPLVATAQTSSPFKDLIRSTPTTPPSTDPKSIFMFEWMSLHPAGAEVIRPVIIIGPNKNSIIDNLVALMSDKYKACVPHSTRSKREEETHGEDYFFVTQDQMQALVGSNHFAEVLTFQGDTYGTSFDSIISVSQSRSRVVVDINNMKTLEVLRGACMVPIVVLLKPKNVQVILDEAPNMTSDAAQAIFDRVAKIEKQAELFSNVVQYNTIAEAFDQVVGYLEQVFAEPFWAPCPRPEAEPEAGSNSPSHSAATSISLAIPPPPHSRNVSQSTELDPALEIARGKEPSVSSLSASFILESATEAPRAEVGHATSASMVFGEGYVRNTVVLKTGGTSLGFSIAGGTDHMVRDGDTSVYIAMIVKGGAAANSEQLQPHDKIISVNGVEFWNVDRAFAVSTLKSDPSGVTLVIERPVVRVTLQANEGRYGMQLQGGADVGVRVLVSRIQPGSSAAKERTLRSGSQILMINGISTEILTHQEVLDIIKRSSDSLSLVLNPFTVKPQQLPRLPSVLSTDRTVSSSSAASTPAKASALAEAPDDSQAPASGQKLLGSVYGYDPQAASSPFRKVPRSITLPDAKRRTAPSAAEASSSDEDSRRLVGGSFHAVPTFCANFVKEMTCSISLMEVNSARNRYKDILPYDHNRVLLENEENDYINASPVNFDFKGDVYRYIASQGPKEGTSGHFWKMIWQQGVHAIAMLTTLIESGRPKCFQYWPTAEGVTDTFGEFEIQLVSESFKPGYAIREIVLRETASGLTRKVMHMHFMDWPDHGVPEEYDPMLAFIEDVQSVKVQNTPLLVHCSAGIGRTGVYIMLELGLLHFLTSTPADLQSILEVLRSQRMGMVQTEPQYKFVYLALSYVRREVESIIHIRN